MHEEVHSETADDQIKQLHGLLRRRNMQLDGVEARCTKLETGLAAAMDAYEQVRKNAVYEDGFPLPPEITESPGKLVPKRTRLLLELVKVAEELDSIHVCGGPEPIGRLKRIMREWRGEPRGE